MITLLLEVESVLFCLQELYKKHCTILIIDDNSYWGEDYNT